MSATTLHPRDAAGGYWTCPICSRLNLPASQECDRPRCRGSRPQRVERVAERAEATAA